MRHTQPPVNPDITLRGLLGLCRKALETDKDLVEDIDMALTLEAIPLEINDVDGMVTLQLNMFPHRFDPDEGPEDTEDDA